MLQTERIRSRERMQTGGCRRQIHW
uniref:Uncharacterized protein n=1 Tax=Rhizophora mucronata TaxID=61149 RepID=A0A2P2Q7F5_RHIMU